MTTFWKKVEKAADGKKDAQVAKLLGVSRSTIHRWRNGVLPDTTQLLKLEKAWGLPSSHWLGQVEAAAPARFTPEESEIALIKQLRRDKELESAVRALVKRWRFPEAK